MDPKNNIQYLKSHIQNFWQKNNKREFFWRSGPISRAYNNFCVLQIEPEKHENQWVYITLGASEIHSSNHEHLEFFILSPKEYPPHIDTLAMVANFHADPQYGGIYLGKVINIGRSWMEDSICKYFLVSLPYTIGEKFEYLQTDKLRIRFLWLLPITKNEVDYLLKYGQEKLEEEFEKAEIEYLNPNRPSVV
jgi:hypothetical protein